MSTSWIDTIHHHRMLTVMTASALALAAATTGSLAVAALQDERPDRVALPITAVERIQSAPLGTSTGDSALLDAALFDRAVADGITRLAARDAPPSIIDHPGVFDRVLAEVITRRGL